MWVPFTLTDPCFRAEVPRMNGSVHPSTSSSSFPLSPYVCSEEERGLSATRCCSIVARSTLQPCRFGGKLADRGLSGWLTWLVCKQKRRALLIRVSNSEISATLACVSSWSQPCFSAESLVRCLVFSPLCPFLSECSTRDRNFGIGGNRRVRMYHRFNYPE